MGQSLRLWSDGRQMPPTNLRNRTNCAARDPRIRWACCRSWAAGLRSTRPAPGVLPFGSRKNRELRMDDSVALLCPRHLSPPTRRSHPGAFVQTFRDAPRGPVRSAESDRCSLGLFRRRSLGRSLKLARTRRSQHPGPGGEPVRFIQERPCAEPRVADQLRNFQAQKRRRGPSGNRGRRGRTAAALGQGTSSGPGAVLAGFDRVPRHLSSLSVAPPPEATSGHSVPPCCTGRGRPLLCLRLWPPARRGGPARFQGPSCGPAHSAARTRHHDARLAGPERLIPCVFSVRPRTAPAQRCPFNTAEQPPPEEQRPRRSRELLGVFARMARGRFTLKYPSCGHATLNAPGPG